MGFEIMIEIEAGGTSSKLNQFDEDGKVGGQISDQRPGRLLQPAQRRRLLRRRTPRGLVDRARGPRPPDGRSLRERRRRADHRPRRHRHGASSSFILLNGGFFIRGPTGQYYAMSWANIGDPAANQGRTELVRYDSPTWHGFIFYRVDRRSRRLLGHHAALRQRVQRRAHRGGHRLRAYTKIA